MVTRAPGITEDLDTERILIDEHPMGHLAMRQS
jgi:hypothetical protein